MTDVSGNGRGTGGRSGDVGPSNRAAVDAWVRQLTRARIGDSADAAADNSGENQEDAITRAPPLTGSGDAAAGTGDDWMETLPSGGRR